MKKVTVTFTTGEVRVYRRCGTGYRTAYDLAGSFVVIHREMGGVTILPAHAVVEINLENE
jgi:hypothetical protein